jgi:hypothetical protein
MVVKLATITLGLFSIHTWDILCILLTGRTSTDAHPANIVRGKKNKRIGYAEYHIGAVASFSLKKWASVKKKMTPVINKLLAQYKK